MCSIIQRCCVWLFQHCILSTCSKNSPINFKVPLTFALMTLGDLYHSPTWVETSTEMKHHVIPQVLFYPRLDRSHSLQTPWIHFSRLLIWTADLLITEMFRAGIRDDPVPTEYRHPTCWASTLQSEWVLSKGLSTLVWRWKPDIPAAISPPYNNGL